MKKLSVSLFAVLFALNAFAEGNGERNEILYGTPHDTQCATMVFANALKNDKNAIPEDDENEQDVQQWIYGVFADPDVLTKVLACPEFESFEDDATVRFLPIKYEFPNGRQITINYETQPQVLKQRIAIATKRSIGPLDTPSPKIGDAKDNSLWTNTDPAWYGIMVVQHGAMNEFVGENKNNTISIKYINDNIDKLYPRGKNCTDKSALADDDKIINVATKATVHMEDDSNDYYVAGDVNLQWISYAEMGLDVAVTVATMGGGTVITGVTKSARASKVVKNLSRIVHGTNRAETLVRLKKYQRLAKELSTLDESLDAAKYKKVAGELRAVEKQLHRIDKLTDATKYSKEIEALEKANQAVQEYMKLNAQLNKAQRSIKRIQRVQELEKDLTKLDRVVDEVKYIETMDNLNKAKRELQQADKITDLSKLGDNLADLEKKAAELEKSVAKAVKKDKSVAEYVDAQKSIKEIREATKAYKNLKNAKTGNVATRVLKAFVQTTKGNKQINRGAKLARSSMRSGKVRDWLFQTTLRNIGVLGRLETNVGALYAIVRFGLEMYDWTESSTDEYTNGVEFKPLLLLSADDLEGQENVINYGMWLMWSGDSTNPADDDAAYLQAFDFAEKFHEDLVRTMEEKHDHACDVDIYVVHPVLRNPDTENPELYYLIMNDQPWTTVE